MRDPSGNDVHIDLSSGWVSRTLLHGGLDQPHSLLDISLLKCVRKSSFGNCLRYSDHIKIGQLTISEGLFTVLLLAELEDYQSFLLHYFSF